MGASRVCLTTRLRLFVFQKSKLSLQISPGWSPQELGGGGKKHNDKPTPHLIKTHFSSHHQMQLLFLCLTSPYCPQTSTWLVDLPGGRQAGPKMGAFRVCLTTRLRLFVFRNQILHFKCHRAGALVYLLPEQIEI
jgi:hypothetical protein